MLAELAAIASMLSQGYGVYSNERARSEARDAERRRRREEAFNNLMRAAGGNAPAGPGQAVQPVPDRTGELVGQLGQTLLGMEERKSAEAMNTWMKEQQERRTAADETRAAASQTTAEAARERASRPAAPQAEKPPITAAQAYRMFTNQDTDSTRQALNAILVAQNREPLPTKETPAHIKRLLQEWYPWLANPEDPLSLYQQ